MANKVITWVGSPEAQCGALVEHGYPLTVQPDAAYSLPADVADSLVASSDGWELVEKKGHKIDPAQTRDEVLAAAAVVSEPVDDEAAEPEGAPE